jgi:hypothetical protein
MTTRPLSVPMQKALIAMLRAPLARRRDPFFGEGWQAQDKSMHALVVIRNLHERGLVMRPTRLAVLTIAGRQAAQKIAKAAA